VDDGSDVSLVRLPQTSHPTTTHTHPNSHTQRATRSNGNAFADPASAGAELSLGLGLVFASQKLEQAALTEDEVRNAQIEVAYGDESDDDVTEFSAAQDPANPARAEHLHTDALPPLPLHAASSAYTNGHTPRNLLSTVRSASHSARGLEPGGERDRDSDSDRDGKRERERNRERERELEAEEMEIRLRDTPRLLRWPLPGIDRSTGTRFGGDKGQVHVCVSLCVRVRVRVRVHVHVRVRVYVCNMRYAVLKRELGIKVGM
jgi:hypothetical protein